MLYLSFLSWNTVFTYLSDFLFLLSPNNFCSPSKTIATFPATLQNYIPRMKRMHHSYLELLCFQGVQFLLLVNPNKIWPTNNHRSLLVNKTNLYCNFERSHHLYLEITFLQRFFVVWPPVTLQKVCPLLETTKSIYWS